MKRKRQKIDIVDFNKNIIKEKMKNPLYLISDLDRELMNIPYKSKTKRKNK
jgi:hypothetical protein